MKTIFFDIETGPLPEGELAALLPPFDPAEVKTGNLKDSDKIAAKIADAEASHRADFFDKAALDPLTGRVLAVGLLYADSREFLVLGNRTNGTEGTNEGEAELLREFWDVCRGDLGRINQMVGFNTWQFDLPFLFRRSWKHRVPVPPGLRRGRYWAEQLIDLREIWQLGDRQARGSLDAVAKHLGVGAKNGDGHNFAKLWQSDRAKAVEYLRNDVELTRKVAEAMGVF
ncbi:MAG: ribonuclease H-like domain-containing protein [Verrucomicrobia bacterium]|nr:ribonuclease H-like domain-containing protein [Verrucomicrobiota bacterium]